MANLNPSPPYSDSGQSTIRLRQFTATNLFRRSLNPRIDFPIPPLDKSQPAILILEGPNGSGKTTILQMIAGILSLDFDIFRQTPFTKASLSLSTGHVLRVVSRPDEYFPLKVSFNDVSTLLPKDKENLDDPKIANTVKQLRAAAKPLVDTISYQLVDIHRSIALRREPPEDIEPHYYPGGISYRLNQNHDTRRRPSNNLSRMVRDFIREAQINYRKFFAAEQLELLPRILSGLAIAKQETTSKADLANQVSAIQERSATLSRFGLQTDDTDLQSLKGLLAQDDQYNDPAALAVLEAYVEMQKNRHQTQELIAKRLIAFENIMDEFLVGKRVRLDSRSGLSIATEGGSLEETQLSSGEYHFLYMMVTALLCYRSGSIIAIDEPELSLHVTWQRKVIAALARCASGASPLFIFATHASAISAEHKDLVKTLAVEG
jgi:ABC-type lipoprotein export system ATPase subunit